VDEIAFILRDAIVAKDARHASRTENAVLLPLAIEKAVGAVVVDGLPELYPVQRDTLPNLQIEDLRPELARVDEVARENLVGV
jgi:hypothetical protein